MDGARILVADGAAEARARTAELLSGHGYRVEQTGSGAEAVRLLDKGPFACAVVDAELDDMSGLEAIELLRQKAPHLPIVATAAQNTPELETAVRELDVLYYHVKAFEPQELVQAVDRATSAAPAQKRATILVVDDDPDYQTAVRQLLESVDYEVISAYTKAEGLRALEREKPDLVILDIMMESMSAGFHFLYELKSDPSRRLPPVLSVSSITQKTGYRFSPTTDEEYFPADDFLPKPASPDELLGRVQALLAGYRPPRHT